MRCLVTGGTGFIGRHLVRELCARGTEVRCLVRASSDLSTLSGLPVVFADGDLNDLRSLERAVEDVDVVYHSAGLLRTWRKADFESVNAGGTGMLLEACRTVNPSLGRFVLVSSLAAAGPSLDGRPLTEEATPSPSSDYGRSKRAGELIAETYADRVPITVVRPPVVYGPGDRQTLLLFKVAGFGVRPSLGNISFCPVHVDDLVRGLLLAGEHEAAPGRTYFMGGQETATLREIFAIIASALGRRGVSLPVPYLLAWSAACLAEAGSGVLRKPLPMDRNRARDLYVRAWACDSGRARRELGYTPEIPLAEGLRETALWYRQQGWIR